MTLSRRFTSIAWLLAGLLFAAGMAATPWEKSSATADYLTTIGTHSGQAQVAALLLHFAGVAMVPAFFGLYWQMKDRPGRLRTIGGVLAVFGAIGFSGMLVVDFYAIALQHSLPLDQAVKVEEGSQKMAGALIIRLTTVIPMMLGLLLLVLAAWRRQIVALWVPIAMVVLTVGPGIVGSTAQVVGGLGLLVAAVAVTGGLAARDGQSRWSLRSARNAGSNGSYSPANTGSVSA